MLTNNATRKGQTVRKQSFISTLLPNFLRSKVGTLSTGMNSYVLSSNRLATARFRSGPGEVRSARTGTAPSIEASTKNCIGAATVYSNAWKDLFQ